LHVNFGMITQCTPNPISGSASIKFSVFNSSNVEIRLYDLSGKLISKVYKKRMAPGKYKIDWNTNNNKLAGGFYLLSLQINGLNVHNLKVQVL